MLRKFSPLLDMSQRADASSWHSLAALRREEQNGSDGQVTAWRTCLSYLHPRFPAHTSQVHPTLSPTSHTTKFFLKKSHHVDWCCSIILSLARSLSFSRSLSLSRARAPSLSFSVSFLDYCSCSGFLWCCPRSQMPGTPLHAVCVCVCVWMCVCVCGENIHSTRLDSCRLR